MTQQTHSKSTTAVLGIGVTGLSVARFLQQCGESFVVCDTRAEPPMLPLFQQEFAAVECYLGGQCEQVLAEVSEIVVSPGLDTKHSLLAAARQRGVAIIGDIELFARYVSAPVVAITGSNGKSTVTELLGEMSRIAARNVAVGGNLGTPALSLLDEKCDLYVLELSSFQLELVDSLRPEVATILNLSPDHLDRYQTMAVYTMAKQRIYKGATVAVVNAEDRATYPAAGFDGKLIEFSLGEPVAGAFGVIEEGGATYLKGPQGLYFPVDEMGLQGRHNWANAMAALAMGFAVGLPLQAMLTALRGFKGLAHRCQYVANIAGVKYINDSKATNVGSALAAIDGLGLYSHANLVWIAGGVGKGAEFETLKPVVSRCVKKAILLGADAGKLAATLQDDTDVELVDTLELAVKRASEVALPGDIVLLSPACASLDMFKNFEVRGECFQQAVEALQ